MPFLNLFRSTVGLKILMGLSGLGLFGFVVVHMLGNLQIFAGQNTLNRYAELLKASPELLWGFRLGLLTLAVVHVVAAVALTRLNRVAKGQGHEVKKPNKASLASRTMMVTGIVALAFIVFHILHFTTFTVFPSYRQLIQYLPDGGHRHDVYTMMVNSFGLGWVSAIYIISMACIGFHLSHGVASLFRSLGLTDGVWRRPQEVLSLGFAAVIFVGMSIIPLACLLGWVIVPAAGAAAAAEPVKQEVTYVGS